MFPIEECITCYCPVGHHLLKCDRDTLQQDLKETLHEIPVEPLTGQPKIVHPFLANQHRTLLMPPPLVPANFIIKLKQSGQNEDWPSLHKDQDVICYGNPVPGANMEALIQGNRVPQLLSLDPFSD